ncbi:MAG: type III-B CRISPR module-associated Cmr3 family protein [Isosphaeraceae bacterium]
MIVTILQLTPHDPIIARDGRPFGAGQGNRMRGLNWPLPSVVAGSFRTALVKAHPDLDFGGDVPRRVMAIEVAGAFPTVGEELYLPAPNDCVWNGETGEIHAVKPLPIGEGGCDFPVDGLRPAIYSDDPQKPDFKPKPVPAWWPVGKLTDWLLGKPETFDARFLDARFLNAAVQETRDHVSLDAERGAAAEGQIFATAGLSVTHLPRFDPNNLPQDQKSKTFAERFAEITLSVRVTIAEKAFEHVENLNTWHPLGGERRLVHWQRTEAADLWKCPEPLRPALGGAEQIRMVLATPAIFDNGWRPAWLDASTLTGKPIGDGPTLKLVGLSNARWKAVSGWSLAPPRGPKPIRRMVPAGSVYFFEKVEGDTNILATQGWLRPVSDSPQDRNDGFGLAIWGTW